MFQKLRGIIGTMFQLGIGGPQLKQNTDGIEFRNAADGAPVNAIVARPQGAAANTHASTMLDVKERAILIQLSFDGASAPAAGTNSGNYGFCHTAGGSFNAGEIYFDSGTALTQVAVYKMQCIETTSSISGSVSLMANGHYIAQTGSAPYTWTAKGDGATVYTGMVKWAKLDINATAGNFDTTTTVPTGSKIMAVITNVTAAYDAGATIAVSINGSTPITVQATSENNPLAVESYKNEPLTTIGGTNTGVVRAVLGGSPTVGAAEVLVGYVETFLP